MNQFYAFESYNFLNKIFPREKEREKGREREREREGERGGERKREGKGEGESLHRFSSEKIRRAELRCRRHGRYGCLVFARGINRGEKMKSAAPRFITRRDMKSSLSVARSVSPLISFLARATTLIRGDNKVSPMGLF